MQHIHPLWLLAFPASVQSWLLHEVQDLSCLQYGREVRLNYVQAKMCHFFHTIIFCPSDLLIRIWWELVRKKLFCKRDRFASLDRMLYSTHKETFCFKFIVFVWKPQTVFAIVLLCCSGSIAPYKTLCAFLSLAFLPSTACNHFLNVSRVFSVLIEYLESIRKIFLASWTIKRNNLAKLRHNNSFSCFQTCSLSYSHLRLQKFLTKRKFLTPVISLL